MAKKTSIEIVIDPATGEITAEAFGYVGEACSIDMGVLTKMFDIKEHRRKRPERDKKVVRVQKT